MKEYKKSRTYFKKELHLAEKIDIHFGKVQALVGIIDSDLERKKYKDVEKYCLYLIKISTKKENSSNKNLAIGYYLLGKIYTLKKDKKKNKKRIAIESFIKAKAIFTEVNSIERLNKLDKFLTKNKISL